mmetsp:Transcript_5791/g.13825  ORF Transcript_5791/g.13825 Transcript_5791/m.13825 type:complete len:349 (-) Transcript_5791:100-1146(-)
MASESKAAATADTDKHRIKDAKKGAFVRAASKFTDWIKADGSTDFPAEAGRYRLYVARACPWANRTTMLLNLKGLEDVIELVVTSHELPNLHPGPDQVYRGWRFDASAEGATADPDGFEFLDQVYEKAAPGYRASWESEGKRPYYSVPVLYDTKTDKIVNNESSDIIVMLNSEFNAFAKNPDLDLNPAELADAQAEINDRVYPHINDGVYRCGFAQSQEAYDAAIHLMFGTLDWLEGILAEKRYTTGSRLTLADLRLFSTLVRFDMVYVTHFKCNIRRLHDYPNLWGFMLEIYQMPGVADTIFEGSIKAHYYGFHRNINPFGIIPAGFDIDLTEPHGRDAPGRFGNPE